MWIPNDVKEIGHRSGYLYRIVLDDGTGAVIDFSEYLDRTPVFAPVRDREFFRRARIAGGTMWMLADGGNGGGAHIHRSPCRRNTSMALVEGVFGGRV
jgi:hypothetical protein